MNLVVQALAREPLLAHGTSIREHIGSITSTRTNTFLQSQFSGFSEFRPQHQDGDQRWPFPKTKEETMQEARQRQRKRTGWLRRSLKKDTHNFMCLRSHRLTKIRTSGSRSSSNRCKGQHRSLAFVDKIKERIASNIEGNVEPKKEQDQAFC